VLLVNFFEKPKLVTAVVFFAETILCLMKVEYFLYLNFSSLLLSLILLSALPIGFNAVYSYILNDMVDIVKPKRPKDTLGETNTTYSSGGVMTNPSNTELPKEKEVEIMEDKAVDEATPVVSEQNEAIVETTANALESDVEPESETIQKKIQIVDTDEVYLEKEDTLPRTRAARKKQK